MSYTFLPYQEQKVIKREYRLRAIIVLLFFLSIAFVVGVGSLFPAYIYATFEEQLHLDQVAAFKKSVDASAIATTQKQLSSSASLLTALSGYADQAFFSSTTEMLVSVHGSVVINSIALEQTSATQMVASLSGVAPTRSDLLSFEDRLKNIPGITNVDLPISALAQDTKVPFTIKVTKTLP